MAQRIGGAQPARDLVGAGAWQEACFRLNQNVDPASVPEATPGR
jgi:hypothetical protein